ncbi:hypothetical protein [Pseudonocardia sp. TRM90224]|uniref:hypothetical protein n=1 Tax=Pseudonocardia sp. TRM90224 TaxID=2812678 RepID=UPI001E359142|nr:hypothetical protein [Pseudonocardia sp. TRM90224]
MSAWRLPAAALDRPSYLAHALAAADEHGPGPWPDGGYPLPDVSAPGLMSGSVQDGIRTHHFSFSSDDPAVEQVRAMITDVVRSAPDLRAVQHLHDVLAEHDTLRVADGLGTGLPGQPRERIREVGRWLVENGTRRNAVAAGLVLVGLSGDGRDRDLLLLLGSMEELTLYAVVALGRTQPDRERAIFEMARRVRNWGRIHCVERLAGSTDPEITAWLLRDGFRNGVMNEYLAHIAATTGDLAGALAASDVDDALLDGAGGILAALCDGSPAKDMSDYADGPSAIERYLRLVRHRPSVPRIRAVLSLDTYLDDDRCQEILTDPAWIATVRRAIESTDKDAFAEAIWPARRLGIPVHDHATRWLESHPYEMYLWSVLDATEDAVALAERLLPLAELATGPEADDGVGPAYRADRALSVAIRPLAGYPGRGWPLVRTAVANRTVLARNCALHVLKAWPPDTLPPDAVAVLERVRDAEPEAHLRSRITELLASWAHAGPAG